MNHVGAVASRSQGLSVEGAEALSGIGWLSRMPGDFRDAMLSAAIWRTAQPGTAFMHAGATEGGMFAIARGIAEIAFIDGHPDARLVDLVHAGFWAGYRPLLGRPRALSLVARNTVLWALVPQSSLIRMLGENPRWWQHLMQLSEDNIEIVTTAFADLMRKDSQQRVAAVLLRLAGCRQSGPPAGETAEVRVSQADLAAMAVMSRNTLNTIIGALESAGQVSTGYRSIILRDAAAMRALLAQD